ncbi:hypothetical protein [Gulosibacter sp. 10]|uniref:hypothetical protein n=1 Tax=Gulosibacter sp. 10 TaxID=1255570 RepID=UPI00111EE931|nr:hypothetical protein [Gulosibacter sp. 10]
MTGMVTFQLSPLHTYQRRLGNEEIDRASSDAHLYVISRRRRTVVSKGGAFSPSALIAQTHAGASGRELKFIVNDIRDAEVFDNGSYWSGYYRGARVHGEAWHLAAMASHRKIEVSAQEVLYVGQAFGTEGSRNASIRAKSHSMLIRAYEENYASDWDVFFTPIVVEQTSVSNDDHITLDDGNWKWVDEFCELFSPDGRRTNGLSVDILEHMLIAYFEPTMNTKLLKWTATKANRTLKELGLRLLSVQFYSLHELSAFFSKKRHPSLSHAIAAEIPGSIHGGGFTLGEYSDLQTRPQSFTNIVGKSMNSIAEMASNSPAILRIFGEARPPLNPDFSAWR